jgi:hypothetical protein
MAVKIAAPIKVGPLPAKDKVANPVRAKHLLRM